MQDETFHADAGTAFILGNGPSLRGVDLKRLPGPTFGMNAAYRYWRTIDWRPTFYSCLDLVVGLSHREAIAELIEEGRIERFLLRSNLIDALGDPGKAPTVVCWEELASTEPLVADPRVTTGSHTTLWAASMGFRRIVLAGIDGHYRERVDGAREAADGTLEIVDAAPNPNYFFDEYQKVGDRYNIPNPRPGLHVQAFALAGARLSAVGVRVVNANPRSEVGVFPTVDLDRALGSEGSPVAPPRQPLPDPDAVSGGGEGRGLFARLVAMLRADGRLLLAWILFVAAVLAAAIGAQGSRWAVPGLVLFGGLTLLPGVALVLVRRRLIEALALLDQRQDGFDRRLRRLEAALASSEGPPASGRSGASHGAGENPAARS